MTTTPPLSSEGAALLDAIGSKRPSNLAIAKALREIIFAHAPGATEEVKYGGLHYSHGRPFCGIFSHASHVSLEFSRGAEFDDGVLLGDGKFRRHLKFTDSDGVDADQVGAYVTQAFQRC